MKIKTEPLLGAAMVGIVLLVVFNTIYLVVAYNTYQNTFIPMFESMLDPAAAESFATGATPPFMASFEQLWSQIMVLNVLSCLVLIIAGVAPGAIYVVLHNRREPLTSGAAKGGAAAGALAMVIGMVIITILSAILFFPLQMEMMEMMSSIDTGSPAPPFAGFSPATLLIGSVVGLLCSTLFYAGFGGFFGAIGGVVAGAVVKKPS